MSPTDCSAETSRPRIARRFGSAMISNTDSTLLIYAVQHMPVKAYKRVTFRRPGQRRARPSTGQQQAAAMSCAALWLTR
jgi:hypothetical protein